MIKTYTMEFLNFFIAHGLHELKLSMESAMWTVPYLGTPFNIFI